MARVIENNAYTNFFFGVKEVNYGIVQVGNYENIFFMIFFLLPYLHYLQYDTYITPNTLLTLRYITVKILRY